MGKYKLYIVLSDYHGTDWPDGTIFLYSDYVHNHRYYAVPYGVSSKWLTTTSKSFYWKPFYVDQVDCPSSVSINDIVLDTDGELLPEYRRMALHFARLSSRKTAHYFDQIYQARSEQFAQLCQSRAQSRITRI